MVLEFVKEVLKDIDAREKAKTYSIKIEIRFRAGHRLMPPYKGKCNNPHGEGYTAIVEFESNKLDENGMVFDFGTIKKQIKAWIDVHWDHAFISQQNDKVIQFLDREGFKVYYMNSNPTAEKMAECLYDVIKGSISDKVSRVGIVESFEDSIAYYEEKQ